MSTQHIPSLYLVTDRKQTHGRPLLGVIEAAVAGGVDAVQLREKDLPARDLMALASAVLAVCRRHHARMLINDRIDVALAVGADGVHLPGQSFSPGEARDALGLAACIGVSTHTLQEARAAAAAGADFVVFGPVFDTPSKRPFGPPVGLDALREICTAVTLPVLAIGGVTALRVQAVRDCGACGVALVSAIMGAEDPERSARQLRSLLRVREP